MTDLRWGLRVFLFVMLATVGTSSRSASAMPFEPFNMRIGAIGAFQSGGANSYSGELAWAPELSLGLFGVRANLGGTLLKKDVSGTFFALDTEGFLCFTFLQVLTLELGGGAQTWIDFGGTAPIISGNIVLNIPKVMGLVDRIYAGYSSFQLENATTSEVHVGIGF